MAGHAEAGAAQPGLGSARLRLDVVADGWERESLSIWGLLRRVLFVVGRSRTLLAAPPYEDLALQWAREFREMLYDWIVVERQRAPEDPWVVIDGCGAELWL